MKPLFEARKYLNNAVRLAVLCSVVGLPTWATAQSQLSPPADSPATASSFDIPVSPNDIGTPPTVLISSFFGGGLTDTITSIRANAAGQFFIAGRTTSTDMPTTPGAQRMHGGGGSDGFVAKFSADGRTLLYSTYIGTGNDEYITGLALDAAGNAYVSGYVQASGASQSDAFLIKIVDNGTSLAFTVRIFGGAANDRANDVIVTSTGTVVVVGTTASPTGFGSPNAMQANLVGSSDGFIRRYDSNLNLLSSTYLGGPFEQGINAVDVGGAGNITIAGYDTNFGNTFDNHVWVARINAAASQVLWTSTLIGNAREEALDVRISTAGDAILGGWTESSDFFTVNDPSAGTFPGLFQSYGHNKDGFVAVVANGNGNLLYASYLNGPGIDFVRAVERGSNNDIIVFGDAQPNPDNVLSKDAFVIRFNSVLQVPQSLDYVAIVGSSLDDYGLAMARTANGALFVAGSVGGSNFFTTPGCYMPTKPSPYASSFFRRLADPEEMPEILFANGFE